MENNVIKCFQEMGEEFNNCVPDIEKFVDGNNSAGTRVRKAMQYVKNLAQQIRVEIQNQKHAVSA